MKIKILSLIIIALMAVSAIGCSSAWNPAYKEGYCVGQLQGNTLNSYELCVYASFADKNGKVLYDISDPNINMSNGLDSNYESFEKNRIHFCCCCGRMAQMKIPKEAAYINFVYGPHTGHKFKHIGVPITQSSIINFWANGALGSGKVYAKVSDGWNGPVRIDETHTAYCDNKEEYDDLFHNVV